MENNCGLQNIVNRVCQMEQYMDEVAEALKSNPEKINNSDELRKKVEILAEYMDSGQWLTDYEADENERLVIKEDENQAVQWWTFEEALQVSTEPWMVERIYKKLIEKGRQM